MNFSNVCHELKKQDIDELVDAFKNLVIEESKKLNLSNINEIESESNKLKDNLGMRLRSGKVLSLKSALSKRKRGGAKCTIFYKFLTILLFIAATSGATFGVYCYAEQQLSTLRDVIGIQVKNLIQGFIESATLTIKTGNPDFFNKMWEVITKLSTGLGADRLMGSITPEGSLIMATINRTCELLVTLMGVKDEAELKEIKDKQILEKEIEILKKEIEKFKEKEQKEESLIPLAKTDSKLLKKEGGNRKTRKSKNFSKSRKSRRH